MDDFLNSPWLLLIIGYVLARWDKRGDQQQTQNVDATNIKARLQAAEEWIERHSDIKADFTGMAKGLETVTKAIERLTERFDEFLSSPAITKRTRA